VNDPPDASGWTGPEADAAPLARAQPAWVYRD